MGNSPLLLNSLKVPKNLRVSLCMQSVTVKYVQQTRSKSTQSIRDVR